MIDILRPLAYLFKSGPITTASIIIAVVLVLSLFSSTIAIAQDPPVTPQPTLEQDANPVDSDGDNLSDDEELAGWQIIVNGVRILVTSDPSDPDTDGDGLSDGEEYDGHRINDNSVIKTDPRSSDTDEDRLEDDKEVSDYKTDPSRSDHDKDGLSDGDEVLTHLTEPTIADTDGDGLSDGDEVLTHLTNPTIADTDGDGLNDGEEIVVTTTAPTDTQGSLEDYDTQNENPSGSNTDSGINNKADIVSTTDTDTTNNMTEQPDGMMEGSNNLPDINTDFGINDNPDIEAATDPRILTDTIPIPETGESGVFTTSMMLVIVLFIGIAATGLGIGIFVWLRSREPNASQTRSRGTSSGGQIEENIAREITTITNIIEGLRRTNNYPSSINELSTLNTMRYSRPIQNLARELVAILEEANQQSNRVSQDIYIEEQALTSQINRLIRACNSDIPDSSQRRIPLGLLNACNDILNSSEPGISKVTAVRNVSVILELLYSWFFPNRRP